MGQSLVQMYIHLTFGTKGRRPLITDKVEERLYAYIAGILKKYDSPALIINSVPDHIHILLRLSKNFALAKIVEDVKKDSSKWMKKEGIFDFKWQLGYGAFSISYYNVDIAINYIKKQKEHHNVKTYKEEIDGYMTGHNITEYDKKYFWS